MNVIFIVLYVIFAVVGSTLLKYGGLEQVKSLFTIPFVNMSVSWITLVGFICYGISFLLYTILLNKFALSFISPLTVSLVYILLMVTAFVIFKEPVTVQKIIGSSLILCGILMIISDK
jgi:drug/metabolite transporter (DMT)-like permease